MNLLEVYIEKKRFAHFSITVIHYCDRQLQKVQLKKVNRNYRKTTLTFYIMDRFCANNNGMLGGEVLLQVVDLAIVPGTLKT